MRIACQLSCLVLVYLIAGSHIAHAQTEIQSVPSYDDPLFSQQYYWSKVGFYPILDKEGNNVAGKGITIAVIDSGVDTNNVDIVGALKRDETGKILFRDFVSDTKDITPNSDHATFIAGIIAAEPNNGYGVAGIVPAAKIMSLNVVSSSGGIDTADVIEAIYFAVDNGANIINLSIGGIGTTLDFKESYNEALEYAYRRGVFVVAAAGNGDIYNQNGTGGSAVNLDQNPSSPVCNDIQDFNNVIGVGSLNANGFRSDFSNFGAKCVDFSTFGDDIVGLSHKAFSRTGTEYDIKDGTSFAAPIVSSFIAFVWSLYPELKPWQIQERMLKCLPEVSSTSVVYGGKLGRNLSVKNFQECVIPETMAASGPGTFGVLPFQYSKPVLDAVDVTNAGLQITAHKVPKYAILVFEDSEGRIIRLTMKDSEHIDTFFIPFDELEELKEDQYSILIRTPGGDSNLLKMSVDFCNNSQLWPDGFRTKCPSVVILEEVITQPEIETNKSTAKNAFHFPDSVESPYVDAISELFIKKVLNGYPDGLFRPQNFINRAEFLKIVLNSKGILASGTNCFPDVTTQWFAGYVCAAKSINIIAGYPDGTFKPANNISVAEALKITLSTFQVTAFEERLGAAWYEKYATYAVKNELWVPSFKEVASLVTREEMAELVYRLLNK